MAEQDGTYDPEPGRAEKAKEKAREVAGRAGSKASEVASDARYLGGEAVREGKEKARDVGHEAKEKAREVSHEAKEKARSRAEEQKERVAAGVRTMADALRRGSEELPEDQRPYRAFLNGVADRVEGASRYLEEHDVDGLARETRRVARDHTPLFLGGAFTLGFAGARMLKSSADAARGEDGGGALVHQPDRARSRPAAGVEPYRRSPVPAYPRSAARQAAGARGEGDDHG